MRVIIYVAIVLIGLSAACGGESEIEVPADSTVSVQPDSIEVQEEHHTSPQDAITGAHNLIDEARSAADQVNDRTEELEQMMGDM